MGGNENGISRNNLYNSLILAYKFKNNTEEFIKEELEDVKINKNYQIKKGSLDLEEENKKKLFEDLINRQVEEIFNLLSSDPKREFITIQDFINMMTCDTDYAIDNLDFFQI
jgi:hypothetical protein